MSAIMPPSATEGKRVLLQANQKLTNVLVLLAYPVSPVAVVVVVVVVTAYLFTFFFILDKHGRLLDQSG